MAEATTIARPYANALFGIANDKGQLKAWSETLAVLAEAASHAEMEAMIASPSVTDEQVIDVMASLLADDMVNGARQFLTLLADNKRLSLLGDIAELYEVLRAEAEQVMSADVSTAKPLTAEQETAISAALKQRTGRDVTLNVSVDESLLGGAIIRAGDLIIDGSALGKLNRLASVIH